MADEYNSQTQAASNQLSAIRSDIASLRAEGNTRHRENHHISELLAKRQTSMESKIDTLWKFRHRIMIVIGTGSFIIGELFHVVMENLDLIGEYFKLQH